MFLSGYQYWKKYEEDYRRARKDAYYADKERMAEILVRRTEETLIPGLSDMIEEFRKELFSCLGPRELHFLRVCAPCDTIRLHESRNTSSLRP